MAACHGRAPDKRRGTRWPCLFCVLCLCAAGLRDASRYGLLLLGREEEVRQRREELEGQWASRRQSTTLSHSNSGHSLAGTLQRNLPHSTSSGSVSLVRFTRCALRAILWLAENGAGLDRPLLGNARERGILVQLGDEPDGLARQLEHAQLARLHAVAAARLHPVHAGEWYSKKDAPCGNLASRWLGLILDAFCLARAPRLGTVSRANVKSGDRRRSVMDLAATKSSGSDKEFNFVETKGSHSRPCAARRPRCFSPAHGSRAESVSVHRPKRLAQGGHAAALSDG